MSDEWLKTSVLETILKISARTLRNYIKQKKVIARKSCNAYFIYVPSLPEDMRIKVEKYLQVNFTYYKVPDTYKYSEEAKRIALSKYDLVMKWRNFAFNYKGTKVDSVKDFFRVYNANKEADRVVYKEFKTVGASTLFRWNSRLKKFRDDWKALLPHYRNTRTKQSYLSETEKDMFLKFLLHPNRTNIGKATSLTKHILSARGITNFASDITYRRFANKYKKEHYDIWVFSREGTKALRDKVIPYIERDISKIEVGDRG